jgi:hypothetical protein
MKALAWMLLAVGVASGADIRSVDFKNGLYRPSCRGRKPVVVKDGVFQREDERFGFRVLSVQYGDVTGDGKEDAVVLTACRLGGTGNPTEGFIFVMKSDKASQVARVPEGDRALGGIEKLEIEGGMLKVTRKQGQAACCAERLETTTYKLEGARLVQVGDVVVRMYEGK